MADTRINALATTAAATAADDYFVIDGTTNGTRKHTAYTPVFSTVEASGSMTITGATGSLTLGAATETLAIAVTAAGAGTITPKSGQNLTIANGSGALLVTGTGAHTFAGTPTVTNSSTSALWRFNANGIGTTVLIGADKAGTTVGGSADGDLILRTEAKAIRISTNSGSTSQWVMAATSGNVTQAGTLTISDTTDSSSKDTGALVVEGGLGVEKAIVTGGAITTAAPTTGTAGAWKFGIRVAATTSLDTTQYIQLDVGGTLYKLALVTV